MADSLKVRHELIREGVILRALEGQLDEHLDPSVLDPKGARIFALDLDAVTHVTSFGVREWIRMIKPMHEKVDALFFLRASPRLTDQFNMIMGFDGGGTLLSFQAYLVCSVCGEESESSFDAQLDRALLDALEQPKRQCRYCGQDAELDDDPAVLFEYARATSVKPPPPELAALLRLPECWIDDVPGIRLSTRTTVEGDVTRYRLTGTIDKSLQVRRMSEGVQGQVELHVGGVSYFDDAGLDSWKNLMTGLLRSAAPVLVGANPAFLRRVVDDPSLLSGVPIRSLALPARCGKCRTTVALRIPVASGGSFRAAASAPCPKCGTTVALAVPGEALTAFHQALTSVDPNAPRPSAPVGKVADKPVSAEPLKTPAPAVPPKDSFTDKYEILTQIGQGGMAEVFLVRQRGAMGFKRLVVIKKVRGDLLTDDRMVRLFLDEARLAARVEHTNVIRIHDLGRVDGTFYMVMDFIHGRSLIDVCRVMNDNGQVAPPAIVASMAADLCAGLARAHMPDSTGAGLVHRDVTLGNVLVSFDGLVKLVDFGLAGYRHFKKDETRQNQIIGNVFFTAPEIYLGNEAVPATDLWGVALIMHVLLTGKHPFSRPSNEATVSAIVSDKVRRPFLKIPRKLFPIISRALEKDPKDRYASASEMERELRALLPKLSGPTDIGVWMRDIFAPELARESAFIKGKKAANLSDALLISTPAEVTELFNGRLPGSELTDPHNTTPTQRNPHDSPTVAIGQRSE